MNDAEIRAGLAPTPGYRYALAVGDQLLVAGQVPLDGAGGLVGPDDPAAQAMQCLDNLAVVVEVHGWTIRDVRHLTIHVVGPREDLAATWDVVRAWFDDVVPPATLLGCPVLGHAGQVVEVDAVVIRDREVDPSGPPSSGSTSSP